MSLTPLHAPRAARKKYAPEEMRRINAHFLLTEFAEDHEAELLRKVHAGHTVEGTPFNGDVACRVVATYLDAGASFHEALIEAAFYLDFEGHFFHWRRYDLIDYRPKLCPEKTTKRRKGSKQS